MSSAAEPVLRVKRLRPNAVVPRYMTANAAGLDLVAAIDEPLVLGCGQRASINTGLAVAIPVGYEGSVRARSGLARDYGIGLVNAPGTIDADYRGEISVLVINLGQAPYMIEPGQRIAQLVIAPVARPEIEEVDELDATARGAGGFGSTGR
jgi:dUTP pyrophosphatase